VFACCATGNTLLVAVRLQDRTQFLRDSMFPLCSKHAAGTYNDARWK